MSKKKSKVHIYIAMAVLLSVFSAGSYLVYNYVQSTYGISGISFVAGAVVWSILSALIGFIDAIYNEEEMVYAVGGAVFEAVQVVFLVTVIMFFFKFNYMIGFGILFAYNLVKMILSKHPLFSTATRLVSVNRSQLLEGKKEEGLWVTDNLLDIEAMHRVKKEVKETKTEIPQKDFVVPHARPKKLTLNGSEDKKTETELKEPKASSKTETDAETQAPQKVRVAFKVPHLKASKEVPSETPKEVVQEIKEDTEEPPKVEKAEAVKKLKMPVIIKKLEDVSPLEKYLQSTSPKKTKELEEGEVPREEPSIPSPIQISDPQPPVLVRQPESDYSITMDSDESHQIPDTLTQKGVEKVEQPQSPKTYSAMETEESIEELFLTVRKDMSRIFNMKTRFPVEIEVYFPENGKIGKAKRTLTDKKKTGDKWIVEVRGGLSEDVTYGLLAANMADIWFEENTVKSVQDYRKGFSFWIAYKLLRDNGYSNAAYQSTLQDPENFKKIRDLENQSGENGVFSYIVTEKSPVPGSEPSEPKEKAPLQLDMKKKSKKIDELLKPSGSNALKDKIKKSSSMFRQTSKNEPDLKVPQLKKKKDTPEMIPLDLGMTRFLRPGQKGFERKPDKIISLETGDILEAKSDNKDS